MDDGPILVAEIAFNCGVPLELEECERISRALGDREIDESSVMREVERLRLAPAASRGA